MVREKCLADFPCQRKVIKKFNLVSVFPTALTWCTAEITVRQIFAEYLSKHNQNFDGYKSPDKKSWENKTSGRLDEAVEMFDFEGLNFKLTLFVNCSIIPNAKGQQILPVTIREPGNTQLLCVMHI